MMKRIFTAAVLGLSLLVASGGIVVAQEFERGFAAYGVGNFEGALKEWRLSAARGDARSQFNLGLMYANGQGVSQSYGEAAKWYRLSADQGHDKAQLALGLIYALGEGVIQDNIYAHMWFNIAASKGSTAAILGRDDIAKHMTTADISKAQEMARACVAKNYKGC